MPQFHFNLGDSDHGPLGLCATVAGEDKEKALETLRVKLAELSGGDTEHTLIEGNGPVYYITIYINPDLITVDDIDFDMEA